MALSDILKKIVQEAETEAKEILTKAEAAAVAEKQQIVAEANEKITELEARKESLISELQKKAVHMAERENKLALMMGQQSVVEKTLSALYTHLSELSDDAYGAILKNLCSGLSGGKMILHAPKNRLAITQKYAPTGAEVKDSADIKAGFIAEIGNVRIDNSFKSLLFSEHKDALVQAIAQHYSFVS